MTVLINNTSPSVILIIIVVNNDKLVSLYIDFITCHVSRCLIFFFFAGTSV